jgi:hypothetical protein
MLNLWTFWTIKADWQVHKNNAHFTPDMKPHNYSFG